MKWTLKTLVIIALLGALVTPGCKPKSDGELKIGFILSTMQEERYQKDKAYFLEAARVKGVEVEFDSANNDEKAQLAKVENMLAKGVKALVIQPCNSDTAGTMVKLAHGDNVPVIAYDRIINNCDLDFYVTQDSYTVGRLQAEAAAKFTGGKGNYIICCGQAGHSVANEITRGNLETLAKHPGITVVVQQNHDSWSANQAMATVENALTRFNNDIQGVLCNNSGMAQGAVRAAEEQGLTGVVFIAGADATTAACQYIVQGKQNYDVFKAIKPLAETAVDIAVKLAKGEKIVLDTSINNGFKTVPSAVTPVYGFDKTNLDEVVIKSNWKTRDEVYKK